MGRRNKGRGSTKKKRGGKSKQQSLPKNNEGAPDTTTSTPAPNVSEEDCLNELRFKVGDRVNCHMGNQAWVSGTITMRNCIPPEEDEKRFPYRIRLDNGDLVYAPSDNDGVVRKSFDTTEFEDMFKFGCRVEVLEDGEWKSGTIVHSTPNWKCAIHNTVGCCRSTSTILGTA